MMNFKNQRGASFVFWVLIAALFGFLLMMGVKLFPVYYRGLSVKTFVEEIAVELNGKNPSKKQVWQKIEKRLNVNGIRNIKRQDMVFERDKRKTHIGLDYEERIPLAGNIDAVVMFDYRQTIEQKK
jgi:hypothetical protein